MVYITHTHAHKECAQHLRQEGDMDNIQMTEEETTF